MCVCACVYVYLVSTGESCVTVQEIVRASRLEFFLSKEGERRMETDRRRRGPER